MKDATKLKRATVDGMSLTHLVDHMRMMLLFIVQERVNINKIIVK
jgi:hypothetical protein